MRQSTQAKLSGQIRFAKVVTWISSKGVSRAERVIKADIGAAALAATPAKPDRTWAIYCWRCRDVKSCWRDMKARGIVRALLSQDWPEGSRVQRAN